MANTILSAVTSPAMVPDFMPHIHALCVNVGTLTPDWLLSMKVAAELASKLRKPWVLDPAALSCSGFRLKASLELVELKPTVIKGNGSEIIALSSASLGQTKDASNIRQIPDHQEVFADPSRDESWIFELLDFKTKVWDNGSASWFLANS